MNRERPTPRSAIHRSQFLDSLELSPLVLYTLQGIVRGIQRAVVDPASLPPASPFRPQTLPSSCCYNFPFPLEVSSCRKLCSSRTPLRSPLSPKMSFSSATTSEIRRAHV